MLPYIFNTKLAKKMKKLKSLEIKKSDFFKDDFKITFHDKLNCIMGGRGTGKTTLLYFIMSTINKDTEENKVAFNILRNNLGKGELIVEIEGEDGNNYKISKFFGDEPQPTKLPQDEFVPIKKLEKEIICDIYEASAIEEIGRNSEERLKLINKMLPHGSNEFTAEMERLKMELNENAEDILILKLKAKQKEEKLKTLEGINIELKSFKENAPSDIDPKEDEAFNQANENEKLRDNEKRFINKTEELYINLSNRVTSLAEDLDDFLLNNSFKDENLLNKVNMTEAIGETKATIKLINNYLGLINSKIKLSKLNIGEIKEKLFLAHETQQSEFVKLKQKIQIHKEYYNTLNDLTKKENDRLNVEKDFNEDTKKIEKLKKNREIIVKDYNRKKQQIFDARISKVQELNNQFDGQIKINLRFGGITNEYENKLKEALKGTGLRYNELVPKIATKYSPDSLVEAINKEDIEGISNMLGVDQSRIKTLIEKLINTKELFEIETIYCPDLPDFYLRVDKGSKQEIENYQKSDELSTGQRCTTVLPIIFAVSHNPLIIDQPEDNLDNKYITNTIYKIIKEQKTKRQLLFITHNPNIPVLSEAEKNIFLKYDMGSSIDKVGNVEEVKDRILELLEGGKEAFETRQKLYENN